MRVLKPIEAAYAADNVYRVMHSNDLTVFHPSIEEHFNLSAGKRISGTSGALLLKSKTGFGVISKGKGDYRGDAIMVFRGTKLMPHDLITDANVGFQTSATGKIVHAGFNNVFKSMEGEIARFLRGLNPHRIHCVGHSLGGALATLAADYVAEKNIARPVLYTFGCPRVGGRTFAESLTHEAGESNIFRVYHKNDPVSMIPLWPFIHVPMPGTECFVDSSLSLLQAHSMENYINSVSSANSYSSLKIKQPGMDWDSQVEAWLGSKSVVGFTIHTMKMIHNAIMYLVKKVFKLLGIGIQAGLSAGLTFLDQLSMLLAKGAKASKEVAEGVGNLLTRILAMLGRGLRKIGEVTIDFIRWVFSTLSRSLYQMAGSSIAAVHSVLR
ncbi:MAG: lipase family protein [Gammaproteobacteria bacterium]|nr:lipase family protein [Gammaproteobacteria bacterium]MDH5653724.1 lipase family protein [Gammaproteobacteria bacterium]